MICAVQHRTLTAVRIDPQLEFEQQYTSAVIAWAPEDQPSDTEIDRVFGVKYFCRSTSTILAGSDGCSFDVAPFAGRCCGVLKTQKTKRRERPLGDVHGVR